MKWLRDLVEFRQAPRVQSPPRSIRLFNTLDAPPTTTPAWLREHTRLHAEAENARALALRLQQHCEEITHQHGQLLEALQGLYAVHHGRDPERYELLAEFGMDMDPDDAWREPLRQAMRAEAAVLIADITGTHPDTRTLHSGGLRATKSCPNPTEASS